MSSSRKSADSAEVISSVQHVMRMDELILAILNALVEPNPPDMQPSRQSLLACMRVNKHWCEKAKGILWRNIRNPDLSFGTVLHQTSSKSSLAIEGLSQKAIYLRLSATDYLRYRHYAAFVESIEEYHADKVIDEAFCSVLNMLEIRGRVFPRLRKIELHVDRAEPWFPMCFRTKSITDVTIEAGSTDKTSRVAILHQIARFCPELERLALPDKLMRVELDFLRVLPFPSLHKIAINFKSELLDDTMTILLSLAHRLTELDLQIVFTTKYLPKRYVSKSFDILHTLRFASDSGGSSFPTTLRALPRSPRLQRLFIKGSSYFGDYQVYNSVFKAAEEYWYRSPFVELSIDFVERRLYDDHVSDLPLDLEPLWKLRNLQHLALDFHELISSKMIEQMSQLADGLRALRSLKFNFDFKSIEVIPLQTILHITSRLPELHMVTAHIDTQLLSNPLLVGAGDQYQDQIILNASIDQFYSPNLRYIHFLNGKQIQATFVTEVLRRVAPNISIDSLPERQISSALVTAPATP